MESGRVKWFDSRRGFGFITPENRLLQDLFVHYSSISGNGYKSLIRGQNVYFEIGNGRKGLQAINVMILNPIQKPEIDYDAESVGNLKIA
jgi:CspA family cold shock protein